MSVIAIMDALIGPAANITICGLLDHGVILYPRVIQFLNLNLAWVVYYISAISRLQHVK
jgi:hypothetical protein